ncbi:MAG: XdhC family protein [Solirubrobacterales bacterium]
MAGDWLADGRRVVAATLVERIGSAPLDPGAEMLVDDHGRIEGSVTGGCVEGALVEEARRILDGGESRLVTYGISEEEAAGVGLMCGGTVHVFLHELGEAAREPLAETRRAIAAGRPAALATLLDGEDAGAKLAVLEDRVAGSLATTELLDRTVEREARGLVEQGLSLVRRYSAAGEVMGAELRVYIQAFASPPSMVIFGAIDFSAAVARLGRELGFAVTICDARAPFVESPRFSETAEVVVDWPDRHLEGRELGPRDVVLVFTHDPKFDQPALVSALRSGAGYVGALGSRRTHAHRIERLRAAGVAEEMLNRVHAPCGLDIGARTPAETAVSILAEVIAVRTRRSGASLRETSGPIHPRGGEHEAAATPTAGAREPPP